MAVLTIWSMAPTLRVCPSLYRRCAIQELWLKPERYYIVANQSVVPRFESLVGAEHLNLVAASGGKVLLTNHPMAVSQANSPKQAVAFQNG